MGELDGVGRIVRPELGTNIGRGPHVEKADKDKHRRDREPGHESDEKPHDTVELHQTDETEPKPKQLTPKPIAKDSGLDISA